MESSVTYFSERRPCFATQRVMRLYLRLEMRSKSVGSLGDRRGGVTWGVYFYRRSFLRIFLGRPERSWCFLRLVLATVSVQILVFCNLSFSLRVNVPVFPPAGGEDNLFRASDNSNELTAASCPVNIRCGVGVRGGVRAGQWPWCSQTPFSCSVLHC